MAKTQQGNFEAYYCHIEAPTKQDDKYGREHKKRKLLIPDGKHINEEIYRDPLVEFMSDGHWLFKRKLDGENIRVQWDGEQALWNGKTNSFTCNADFSNYMNNTFLEEIFEEKFGRDKKVLLFGEHMGKKVQGNELGLEDERFVLFDVNVNGFWLNKYAIKDIASYFGIDTCYTYMNCEYIEGCDTLSKLILATSRGMFSDWEGIVATPAVECRNQKGERVILKIKNRDYLREE